MFSLVSYDNKAKKKKKNTIYLRFYTKPTKKVFAESMENNSHFFLFIKSYSPNEVAF